MQTAKWNKVLKRLIVVSMGVGGIMNNASAANSDLLQNGQQPTILAGMPHPGKQAKFVEVYAHRGARSFSPENTLPGYKTALAIGVNWVDMDLGITQDGIIVADHDIWLNPDILSKGGKFWANNKTEFYQQLSSAPGGIEQNIQPYLVKNLTLAQLQKYDAGQLNLQSPYAKWFPEQLALLGTRIPSVQEVVNYVEKQASKQINYQLEIKNDPTHPTWTVSCADFAAKVASFLARNNLTDRSEIQSFDWQPLYDLHRINPQLKLAFLVAKEDIERMHSSDPQQAGLWSGGKLLKNYNNSLPQMIKALGGSCYEPEDIALTKEDLAEAHRLGLKVVVWTWPENSGSVFNPKLIAQLIDWGVDGIITDDPAQLNSMLAARGLPVPANFVLKR